MIDDEFWENFKSRSSDLEVWSQTDIGRLFFSMNSIFFDHEPEEARIIIQKCADAAWKDFIKHAKRENE